MAMVWKALERVKSSRQFSGEESLGYTHTGTFNSHVMWCNGVEALLSIRWGALSL